MPQQCVAEMTGQDSLSILMAGAPVESYQIQLFQIFEREIVQKDPKQFSLRHLRHKEGLTAENSLGMRYYQANLYKHSERVGRGNRLLLQVTRDFGLKEHFTASNGK